MRKLPAAFCGRLAKAEKDLVQFLANEEVKQGGETSGVIRMPAKGGSSDTLEQAAWAPGHWRDNGWAPEALRAFGAPWLCAGRPGSCRHGAAGWATPTIGTFIHVITGHSLLLAFPMADALDMGADADTVTQWLFAMNMKPFVSFADKAIRVARLVENSTAWVPYGWSAIVISMTSVNKTSVCIAVPYFCANLAKKCAVLEHVVRFNSDVVKRCIQTSKKPWADKDIANAFLEWLNDLTAPGTQGSPKVPAAPLQALAILDEDSEASAAAAPNGQEDTPHPGESEDETMSGNDH